MTWITTTDPLALVAIQAGQVNNPSEQTGADGGGRLDTPQRAVLLGEPVPIVFARRRNDKGGVLISPSATEARFENDTSNAVTAYYHLVLSEGQIDSIPVKDVFQRSCRVGSHSQTYNRRAGTWTPGNAIIQRSGYDFPECPYYCGTVGAYPGMSTLSFSVTIPDGFDQWNRQVHCFIRGGMRVTRLADSVLGPSDNFADLVNWMLTNSGRVPAALVDTTALGVAAGFLEANGFTCNIWLTEAQNYSDLLAKWAPYFLLGESNNAGKKGLRALLPINNDGTIKTTAITPEYTFTEDTILPVSLEMQYTSLAERQPFVAQVTWRQQLEDDFGIIRTAEVRYAGTAAAGPYESHDLSAFCTSEDHAVKVGAYILAKRVYTTHTLRFSARPQTHNTIITPGDIVRVRLLRQATSAGQTYHDYLYQVERISKTLAGDLSYECTHFPIDSQGRSLVALDVAAATGTGILLTSNKSGVGCDINSSTDNSIPAETFSLADWDVLDAGAMTELEPNYFGGFPSGSTSNTDDGLDNQGIAEPLTVYPSNAGVVEGAAVKPVIGACPDGSVASVKWFYSDTPGGSFEEFNNFGSQVFIVGSMQITATPGRTIRAIWYCGDAPQQTYEAVIEAGTLVEADGYYIHYQKIAIVGGGFVDGTAVSYGSPAFGAGGRLYKYNSYADYLAGNLTDVTGNPLNTLSELRILSLRQANGAVVIDYDTL